MIIDQIDNINRYRHLSPNFNKAIDFIISNDIYSMPLGDFTIDGKKVFGFVKNTLLTEVNFAWEAHKVYADIQIILEGAEGMGYIAKADQVIDIALDEKKDVMFYKEESKGFEYIFTKGHFAIFLPGELHRPDLPIKEYENSRKMVIKVAFGE